jgi:hypothetical protein
MDELKYFATNSDDSFWLEFEESREIYWLGECGQETCEGLENDFLVLEEVDGLDNTADDSLRRRPGDR